MQTILERITKMNRTFQLPVATKPTTPTAERIRQFHRVIREEVDELLDCIDDDGTVDLVAFADTLADIGVYNQSEAIRHGVDLERVTHLVMDSQDSKLDGNGNPIFSDDGSKFVKGPDYQPPEPYIQVFLRENGAQV